MTIRLERVAKALVAAVIAFAVALTAAGAVPGSTSLVQLTAAAGIAVVAGVTTWGLPNSEIQTIGRATKAIAAGLVALAGSLAVAEAGDGKPGVAVVVSAVLGAIVAGYVVWLTPQPKTAPLLEVPVSPLYATLPASTTAGMDGQVAPESPPVATTPVVALRSAAMPNDSTLGEATEPDPAPYVITAP